MAGSYLHKMVAAVGKSKKKNKKKPKPLHKFIKRQLKDVLNSLSHSQVKKYINIQDYTLLHTHETQSFIPRIEHRLWLKEPLKSSYADFPQGFGQKIWSRATVA